MLKNIPLRVAAIATSATLTTFVLLTAGCVQNRPSRNGVFNENQYVRKSFLVGSSDGSVPDSGWNLQATVTSVTTPNPLGGLGIFPGSNTEAGLGGAPNLVRFVVQEDKLQMVNMREITAEPNMEDAPEVVNAWPATNVDLKYRVNLDGENTNFYEENQELDWQVRQWVKLNFAKNDMSDIAPLGSFTADLLAACTDAGNSSATLMPNSFIVDEKNNYMEWSVQITVPILFDDPACIQAYGGGYGGEGALFQRLGRQNSTFVLKYSMVRAVPDAAITYQPMVVDEKDPIRHKYGAFDFTTLQRDPDTGLLASRQLLMRFDPKKPIKWYFTQEFPADLKDIFTAKGGLVDQTNQLLTDSGIDTSDLTKAGVSFHEYNEPDPAQTCASDTDCTPATPGACLSSGLCAIARTMGDVRYSMMAWNQDIDNGGGFLGVTSFNTDVRTGETLSAQIVLANYPVRDLIVERVDAYLQSVGASEGVDSPDPWSDLGACMDGQTVPIVPDTVANVHNANSSVFSKMQQYLQKPQAEFGNLGPQDFIATQDSDFFNAYYAILPYLIYADPAMNQFVTPEGGQGVYGPADHLNLLREEAQFQTLAASIDQGVAPYDSLGASGLTQATAFLNQWRQLTLNHGEYLYKRTWANSRLGHRADTSDAFTLLNVMGNLSRHCINGVWETKEQWITNLEHSFWGITAWHEFGHSLGLEHNFMASVDKPNFPTYQDGSGVTHNALYASSVMEYNSRAADLFLHLGWGPYDQGAISWIYANLAPDGTAPSTSISGQSSPTSPWKDPHGYNMDGTEKSFLRCHHEHLAYTPLCREFDLGTTPSEIIANAIDTYEWQYQWNNFRTYRKYWDDSAYANIPAALIVDMRKFMSLWVFDWGSAELADTFRRIGLNNPNPNGSLVDYYQQLTNKFNYEASSANQMVAAFHKAIIQQSSGERPYKTIYDKFYGDVTQQGIILDKLFAMQGWVALWPTDNYDLNQAGNYLASYEGLGDDSFNYVAYDAVDSMIGGQYDVYPYFVPLAVAQFAQDTHSPAFGGNVAVRDWIGGHVFTRLQDFLDYFRDIAIQNNVPGCTTLENCTYDPRPLSDTHNEFFGPDKRAWIWAYILDRNTWVAVEKDRNTATYVIVRNYTDDVIYQQDDGAFPGGAFNAELPMKYFLDSFNLYN